MTWIHKLWGAKQRPWGFEVRVDVTDTDTGRGFNEVLVFPDKAAALNAKTSGDAIAALKAGIRDRVIEEERPRPVCPICQKVF